MKKYLLKIAIMLSIMVSNVYAQDLNEQYKITLWSRDIKGNYVENHLETVGFLPVFKNTKDELTIGNIKIIYQSFLNIQILEKLDKQIKILIDFKNNNKEYKKEILVIDNEVKDMEDFKIEVNVK